MLNTRTNDLIRFYSILSFLEEETGPTRKLSECSGKLGWPERGVYFFKESGELRLESGSGQRIVRVGTHALKANSKTKLWSRLSQHRGQKASGGGNHRGSIFRLLVGNSLIQRKGYVYPDWGKGASTTSIIISSELLLEREVSQVIGDMTVIYLPLNDSAGPLSLRGYIERNSIALLSNYEKPALDLPSDNWLGLSCDRERVKRSGLWNNNHTDEEYDPDFLDVFERIVGEVNTV